MVVQNQNKSPDEKEKKRPGFGITPQNPPEKKAYSSLELGIQPRRTVGGVARDIGLSAAKGVVGLGDAARFAVDIATPGDLKGALKKTTGYDPKGTQEFLGEQMSDATKYDDLKVSEAEGFVGTAKETIKRPFTIVNAIAEAAPAMLGGAGIGQAAVRGAAKFGAKIGQATAAGLGEGAVGGLLQGSEIESESGAPATAKQKVIALMSGVGTGAFGIAGGRLAARLGFDDIDTFLVSGKLKQDSAGIAKKIIGGGINEGVFEELPQTIQETIWMNAALDKPLLEGVPESAAQGMLVGMAMGGGMNVGSSAVDLTRDRIKGQKPPTGEETLDDTQRTMLNETIEYIGKASAADLEKLVQQLPEIRNQSEYMADTITAAMERRIGDPDLDRTPGPMSKAVGEAAPPVATDEDLIAESEEIAAFEDEVRKYVQERNKKQEERQLTAQEQAFQQAEQEFEEAPTELPPEQAARFAAQPGMQEPLTDTAEPTMTAEQEEARRETDRRLMDNIDNQQFKGRTVQLQAIAEESGEVVTLERDAAEELDSIDSSKATYQKMMECLAR